ncbi:MAG: biotin/lipoyl-binding protein, partial [Bdellovibrionales bacterium]|nr:biotin/lipoyl-binding protein [Bdellovibrionales bacterium]
MNIRNQSLLAKSLLLMMFPGVVASIGCRDSGAVAIQPIHDARVRVRTVAAVETEVIRKTTQPATVHAFHEARIQSKVSGYVRSVAVDIGDTVEVGQTLAEIDVPEMQQRRLIIESRIELLSAEERSAASEVELAKAGIDSAKAKVTQVQSELGALDASLAAAESEFQRTAELVQRGTLQSKLLDEARQRRDSDLSARKAAESAIRSAEAEVAVAQARHGAAV